MIELFEYVKSNTTCSIKLKALRVSYWRSDTINNFISYLETNKDKLYIDRYNIEYGNVLDDTYVKSFDIECKTSIEFYDYLKCNYKRIFTVYNKDNVVVYTHPYAECLKQKYDLLGDLDADI